MEVSKIKVGDVLEVESNWRIRTATNPYFIFQDIDENQELLSKNTVSCEFNNNNKVIVVGLDHFEPMVTFITNHQHMIVPRCKSSMMTVHITVKRKHLRL